jgi:hypothetical protein
MTVARSLLLFALAALAEIGGAWLVWQGVREQRGIIWIGAGVVALGLYGFVATLQPPMAACSLPGPSRGAWSSTASDPIDGTSSARWSAWSVSP